MTRRRSAAVVLALLAVGIAAAVALAAGGRPSDRAGHLRHRTLLFDARFRGGRLDRRQWSTCFWWGDRGCTIATNHELEWYVPGQVRLAHGNARLIAARRRVHASNGRTYPFVSGMISTGPAPGRRASKFAFRYGLVEARMKVPAGRGLWPALWLLPASRSSLPEIDAMEIFGQAPNVVELHLHYRDPAGRPAARGATRRMRSRAGPWHVFAVDWQPGRLTWLIDGRAVFRIAGAAVPSVPMYVLATLAVGGAGPGPPHGATRFPSALELDWVRVWR